MTKLLITGGAGFVGSGLALLFKRDHPRWDICALDNLHRRGAEVNLKRLSARGVRFCHGDIRIPEDIAAAGGFDLMIECSAEPSVLAGYTGAPDYLLRTNLVGMIHCLEACRRQGADMLFLSTSRVYPMEVLAGLSFVEDSDRFEPSADQAVSGITKRGIAETFPLDGVRSIYGATKLCAELLLGEYIAAYPIRGIINRCGVLTGPWQMGKVEQGFVALWVARHLWGGALSYIGYGGAGKQVRDVLHIADLYDLLCLQIDDLPALSGGVFNIGGGSENSVSLRELTRRCQEITGKVISIDKVPETRPADIPYYVTDYRRVAEKTGWRPRRGLDTILTDIHRWLKENEAAIRPIMG